MDEAWGRPTSSLLVPSVLPLGRPVAGQAPPLLQLRALFFVISVLDNLNGRNNEGNLMYALKFLLERWGQTISRIKYFSLQISPESSLLPLDHLWEFCCNHLLFQEFKIIKQLIAWENQKLLVLASLIMIDDYLKGITFLI